MNNDSYDNLLDRVSSAPNIVEDRSRKISFPITLKVHLWNKDDSIKFANLLRLDLSSENRTITYSSPLRRQKREYIFEDNRIQREISSQDRIENDLWINTLDYVQDEMYSFICFNLIFDHSNDYVEFCRLIKQVITLNTRSISFPKRQREKVSNFVWKSCSEWLNPNPVYPIYIVSKGRADSRKTSKTLERMNVPYYVVIEPQEYDEYSCIISPDKILVLPYSNTGDGAGRARNWIWNHSLSNGDKRHWVLDDNISGFFRLHKNRRHRVLDGSCFRICEEFVDRFKNVAIAGLNYRFFAIENDPRPPFVLNTRIYSCLLIDNSIPFRWRGKYNEDVILSLDVLKSGLATIQFNCFLQGKLGTQVLSGGNTSEFYSDEGTYRKAAMLESVHSDVSRITRRYNRWHHFVDYRPFKDNNIEYIDNYDPNDNIEETRLFRLEKHYQQ